LDFSLAGPDKLKIILTGEDLSELGVDYQNLDYKDENTRGILIRLLGEGRAKTGFRPQKAKLYIEIYPRGEGGCVIYYTRLAGGEMLPLGKFLPGPSPIIFAFEDTEVLLKACARTYELYRQRIFKSALYGLGREYRLIIYPLDYNDKRSESFLGEYGRLVGEGIVLTAYIEEHGSVLCPEDALDTLAGIEGGK